MYERGGVPQLDIYRVTRGFLDTSRIMTRISVLSVSGSIITSFEPRL